MSLGTRTSRPTSRRPSRSCAWPAQRAQGKSSSHAARNTFLLLTGITLGVLFNPATGPQTRKWLKDKVLGPEQPFEYQTNEQ